MSDHFQLICDVLRGGAELPPASEVLSEACHERLINALRDADKRNAPGITDLACLTRHVLRRETELQTGSSPSIRVLKNSHFPNRLTWEACGVSVLDEQTDNFLVRARPWYPEWLSHTSNVSPEAASFGEVPRRTHEPVQADPALTALGFKEYRNSAQREAIRAVLLAPPGSTLVLNLPTASGKSLCAQLPALLDSADYGVSVVIVPTTALAIDQERAMSGLVGHPTAYYSDNSTVGREKRAEIRRRIRDGSQRIVFTSPESVLESLAASLYTATERGFLRMLVIDEAHMVEQWGDGFRPAFQELPGFRRDLLRVAQGNPFKTLLMTGTLTESCLDTLEALCGEPGPFDVLSATQLRPEPSYWFTDCETEGVRQRRVMEALLHVPRPLILYTTTVEDAKYWADALRQSSFTRFAIMTGQSTADERSGVIERWRDRKIDIVVATSAFGLGVDQADVRAVIHACIPETFDRFYQEVGRGGRDGRATLSLVAYTRTDLELARRLNKKVSIGVDRGRQRWERMFASQDLLPGDRLRIKIDLAPSLRSSRDINMRSEQNRKWNVRTLTLMACAGLISFDAERPPNYKQQTEPEGLFDESKDEAEFDRSQTHQTFRVIRIRDESHLLETTWMVQVEAIRKKRKDLGRQSLGLMRQALKGKACISQLLAEAYHIPLRETAIRRKGAVVAPACGGCPSCRERGVKPYATPPPAALQAWQVKDFKLEPALEQLLASEQLLIVFYAKGQQEDEWNERFHDLSIWFLKQGIHNVVASAETLDTLRSRVNNNKELIVFFFRDFESIRMPPAPTLIVHSAQTPVPMGYLRMSQKSPVRVLLLPIDATDPSRPHRRLADSFNGRSLGFDELCTMLAL
jgi:ATP-dependent DNA helicase RecQ